MKYTFYVSQDEIGGTYKKLYDGDDPADAMAAWSKAVGEGHEYVTIEALREYGK